MLKLIFYVPESHLQQTKQAIFAAGAGGIGAYQHCAWQVLGTGQFQPMAGAEPYIGQVGQLAQVLEWRVETLVAPAQAHAVKQALLDSHPYQQPAFEFIQLVEI
jgi:hypothetical protein